MQITAQRRFKIIISRLKITFERWNGLKWNDGTTNTILLSKSEESINLSNKL